MPVLILVLLTVCTPSFLLAAPLSETEKNAVCQQRSQCRIERVYPAGKNTNGVSLRVVKLVLDLSKEEQKQAEEDFTKGCRASGSDKKNGGEEYWLLDGQQTPRKILALCNDGYGASGVGEDIITVGNNRFTHTQAGGSASRWESTITLSLSPLRAVYNEGCGYHTLNPNEGMINWNTYDPLMTYTVVKDQTPKRSEDEMGLGCPEKIKRWQWKTRPGVGLLAGMTIPRPSGTFGDSGLTINPGNTLGSCGVDMSLNGSPGFLVFGKTDKTRNGYVRALAPADNTLLIQVYDPQTNQEADANWVHTNHLEIWTASDSDSGGSSHPQENKNAQLGITFDGKVYRGVGAAPLPNVDVWSAPDEQNHEVRVFKLTWQQGDVLGYGFLLAYSQAQGGKQVRIVANAGITRNRPDYLPGSKSIFDRCTVENGRIELIREVQLPLEQQ